VRPEAIRHLIPYPVEELLSVEALPETKDLKRNLMVVYSQLPHYMLLEIVCHSRALECNVILFSFSKPLVMQFLTCYTISEDSVAQWIECVSPEHKVAGSTPATVIVSSMYAQQYLTPTRACKLRPYTSNPINSNKNALYHLLTKKYVFLWIDIYCIFIYACSEEKEGSGSCRRNSWQKNLQHRKTMG